MKKNSIVHSKKVGRTKKLKVPESLEDLPTVSLSRASRPPDLPSPFAFDFKKDFQTELFKRLEKLLEKYPRRKFSSDEQRLQFLADHS